MGRGSLMAGVRLTRQTDGVNTDRDDSHVLVLSYPPAVPRTKNKCTGVGLNLPFALRVPMRPPNTAKLGAGRGNPKMRHIPMDNVYWNCAVCVAY